MKIVSYRSVANLAISASARANSVRRNVLREIENAKAAMIPLRRSAGNVQPVQRQGNRAKKFCTEAYKEIRR